MMYYLQCKICGHNCWVSGIEDSSVNSLELNDYDWDVKGCIHDLADQEVIDSDSKE